MTRGRKNTEKCQTYLGVGGIRSRGCNDW